MTSNPNSKPLVEAAEAAPVDFPDQTPVSEPPTVHDDDDFGDVVLGERQANACSMDEGCSVCQ